MPETSKSKHGASKGRREGEKARGQGQAVKASAGDSEDPGSTQSVEGDATEPVLCLSRLALTMEKLSSSCTGGVFRRQDPWEWQ